MNLTEQKKQIKRFIKQWANKGDEKQNTQSFWRDLLHEVLGVDDPTNFIDFEKRVKVEGRTKFIDGYISQTKILIEQKSKSINLENAERQSDGKKLTPY